MNTKLALILLALIVIIGALYWHMSCPGREATDPAVPGSFVSGYVPAGWAKTEDDKVLTIVQSPDYATAESVATDCGDAGGADCGPVMAQGAQFTLAYDPCPADTATATKAWWQKEYTSATGYEDQQAVTIAGHAAVLYHSEFPTATAHPVTLEYYVAPLVAGDNCREAAYIFIASSSTAYEAELQRFLSGVQFLPAAQ